MDCFPLAAGSHLEGDPEELNRYAADLARLAEDLDRQGKELSDAKTEDAWISVAGDAFRAAAQPVADVFAVLAQRVCSAANELKVYVPGLRSAQADGRLLLELANEVRGNIAWLEQVVHNEEMQARSAAATAATAGLFYQQERPPHQRQLDQAREEMADLKARFRNLVAGADDAARRLARQISAISDDSLKNGGWLDGVRHWVTHDLKNFIQRHAEGLKIISEILNGVSVVLGLLALLPIPQLQLICKTGEVAAGLLSMGINAALAWATGEGWDAVAVDAVGLLLPVGGKLTKSGRTAGKAARAAKSAERTAELAKSAVPAARAAKNSADNAVTAAHKVLNNAGNGARAARNGTAAVKTSSKASLTAAKNQVASAKAQATAAADRFVAVRKVSRDAGRQARVARNVQTKANAAYKPIGDAFGQVELAYDLATVAEPFSQRQRQSIGGLDPVVRRARTTIDRPAASSTPMSLASPVFSPITIEKAA
jgi:hypothetical protein